MDSEYFFNSAIGVYFKTRQGIYVINMPLFKYRGQNIYKVGYARDNLYKRIRDYKTAYGPIHFIIEAIYEIPEKVFHARPNFARLSETRIHKTLIKIDVANLVMRDEETDQQLGEWFFGIKDIIAVIKDLKKSMIMIKLLEKLLRSGSLNITINIKMSNPIWIYSMLRK